MIPKRLLHLLLLVLACCRAGVIAQDKVITPAPVIAAEHADDAPLAFPPLEHYAKLWENSLFTTKSLPPPDDAPKGPVFTDSLTLVGIYEVDGAIVGVLLDRTTSLVTEVRIGAENESGVKIVRVSPGGSPDKMRLQLMKGQDAGWVTFANEAAPPAEQAVQAGPGGAGLPVGSGGSGGVGSPAVPGGQGSSIPGRPPIVPQPNPNGPARRTMPPMNQPPQPQAVPPPVQVVPAHAAGPSEGDIPLPPQ